jgi:hypothetical protein
MLGGSYASTILRLLNAVPWDHVARGNLDLPYSVTYV